MLAVVRKTLSLGVVAALPLAIGCAVTSQPDPELFADWDETLVLPIHNLEECAKDGDTQQLEIAVRNVRGVTYASAATSKREIEVRRLAPTSLKDIERAATSAGCRLDLAKVADVDYEPNYFMEEE